MLHVELVLHVPPLRSLIWELTLASSYNPLQVLQHYIAGFSCILSLLALLSLRAVSDEACILWHWPYSTYTTFSELGVNSGSIIQSSSALQQRTAGFIAFSLCSQSILSGLRRTRPPPRGTGPARASTTLYESGVHATIIMQPSSACICILRLLLHSLSARHPVLADALLTRLAS